MSERMRAPRSSINLQIPRSLPTKARACDYRAAVIIGREDDRSHPNG